MEEMPVPAFNSLGHIALKVKDLDKSIAFYTKLGFPEFLRLTEEDGETWIVYMRITDDLFIELFPGAAVGTTVTDQNGVGLNHLSLSVDDIEATEAHLKRVGIALSQPRRNERGVDHNRGAWIEDPDGNRIEIMEMAPGCIQYAAIRDFHAGRPPHSLVAPRRPRAKTNS
jgi:lactoylglutathione lyase